MSGTNKYKSVIYSLAIVIGIGSAIAANSAFVKSPMPELPTIREGMNTSHVFLLLMLVPIAIVKWLMFGVEFFKVYWVVILCGITPLFLAWLLNKSIG